MAATIRSVLFLLLATCYRSISADQDADTFPLLMPKVQPLQEEDYLCTPIRLSDEKTHFVTGFRPNSTHHIAHHMLVYGCEEPGAMQVRQWICLLVL